MTWESEWPALAKMVTLVPWSGMLGGAIAIGSPAAPIMGALLVGLLVGTTLALVLGGERTPVRPAPVIALRPPSTRDGTAAA